jgi:type IV pilus assembly protein PilV
LINFRNGVPTSGALAATAPNCANSTCTPAQLAAYDVQQWGANMTRQFPTSTASVSCPNTLPITCFINVSWKETQVAAQANTATGSTQTSTLSFSVYVQP